MLSMIRRLVGLQPDREIVQEVEGFAGVNGLFDRPRRPSRRKVHSCAFVETVENIDVLRAECGAEADATAGDYGLPLRRQSPASAASSAGPLGPAAIRASKAAWRALNRLRYALARCRSVTRTHVHPRLAPMLDTPPPLGNDSFGREFGVD